MSSTQLKLPPLSERGDPESSDPAELRPLHGGPHRISPDLVAHSQRERLLSGLASAVAEHGYNATTITQITESASVSRRSFYQNFESKEECFLATYEALDNYVGAQFAEAEAAHDEWPHKVGAAINSLITLFASRPKFARVYLVEAPAVGKASAPLRDRSVERFVALLEPGRAYAGPDHEPAPGIEEALVGGIITQLGRQLVADDGRPLGDLTAAVIEFALAPYLGREAARDVAAEHS